MSSHLEPVPAAPGNFIPEIAVTCVQSDGAAMPVGVEHPLSVSETLVGALSTPLAGQTTQTGTLGPFAPDLGRPIWLTLGGDWVGTVRLERSTDGGVTRQALTLAGRAWGSFARAVNEPIGEETVAGGTWYLDVTLISGTLTYRVQQ